MVNPIIKSTILLGLFVSSFSIAQQDIGALAVQLQKLDSPKAEREVGYKTAARILGSTPLVNDQELTRYVNLVGKALAANSPGQSYNWTFGIIQTEDINAFAAPGGYIFVTKGLLRQLTNEDQLAAVLAHEIAHVRFKHYTTVAKKQMLKKFKRK